LKSWGRCTTINASAVRTARNRATPIDIDNIRSRSRIKRAVIDILREIGMIPPELKPKKPNLLRLVKSEKSEPPPAA
jgi:hypothetical protein